MAVILRDLYNDPRRVVVTAHRGFSARYPENSIPAFAAAAEAGAHIIELDLRGSRERAPVVLHDPNLGRTSDGSGSVGELALAELKELDFSHQWKERGNDPGLLGGSARIPIPTFEEALEAIGAAMGLNIQVKEADSPLLERICALFRRHDLYRRAYLTLGTFAEAQAVRRIDSRIDLCVLERKQPLDSAMLRRMKEFGCRFLQPHRRDVTAQLCRAMRQTALPANMYYSNTDADNRRYIGYGIRGILTDAPDVLIRTIRDLRLPFP